MHGGTHHGNMHYLLLLAMTVLHFVAMYALMYAMVDRWENIYPNNNQLYMAALMTAPMLIFELTLMRFMYPKKMLNAVIVAGGVVLLVGSFIFIRQQTAIGDAQFLKSMIPHHAGAVLMCEQASLEDPGIKTLCTTIVAGQTEEINVMKAKLRELER